MHGLEHEVRTAVNMIMELDVIKVTYQHVWRSLLTKLHHLGLPPRDSLPDRTVE